MQVARCTANNSTSHTLILSYSHLNRVAINRRPSRFFITHPSHFSHSASAKFATSPRKIGKVYPSHFSHSSHIVHRSLGEGVPSHTLILSYSHTLILSYSHTLIKEERPCFHRGARKFLNSSRRLTLHDDLFLCECIAFVIQDMEHVRT